MKIKYKGGGSYFHYPHLFDRYNREIKVTKKIGEKLLKNEELFEEVETAPKKKEKKK